MNELAAKLLEQTPVIIVLGVCLYALWNEKKTQIKEAHDERVLHKNEITEIYTKHAKEIKELNTYIRDRDLETLESLEDVTAAISSIKNLIENKLA